MLQASDILYQSHITQGSKQTSSFLQIEDLSPYSMIMIVSGDGLLHVTLNALFKKTGNESEFLTLLKKLPLAIVPAGTSNGLATSLNFQNAFEATKNAIEGTSQELDIFRIYQPEINNTLWDCGILCWALPAEHDQYQERNLRWIPFSAIRDLLAPLIVILQSKTFYASLTFTEVSSSYPEYNKPRKTQYPESLIKLLIITNHSKGSPDVLLSPHAQINEGSVDMIISTVNTRLEMLKLFLKMSDSSYLNCDKVYLHKIKEVRLESKQNMGYLCLSGEAIPSKPFELKVFPKCARLVYKKI